MRVKLRYLDWQLFIGVIVAILYGLLIVYSASQTLDKINTKFFFQQIIWVIVGIILMIIMMTIPYKNYYAYCYVLLIITIFLLLVPLIIEFQGTRGVRRWIVLGAFFFQPSELAKIVYVMVLARYLVDSEVKNFTLPDLVKPIMLTFPLMFLIMIEPDLGSSLSLVAVLISLLYWKGIRLLYLFIFLTPLISMLTSFSSLYWLIFLSFLLIFLYFSHINFKEILATMTINIISGISFPLFWSMLANYQKKRITIFWDPNIDPKGQGWNVIQSMVSIGSGGFLGKGYMQGTQKSLGFLPVQHTDFVYPVIGEEWGFIGCTFILLVFLFIIYRLINSATSIRNPFASLVVIGICSILAFHVFVNIGMTIGLVPVTGIVLPFISYGGSSISFFLISIGIVQSINLSRSE